MNNNPVRHWQQNLAAILLTLGVIAASPGWAQHEGMPGMENMAGMDHTEHAQGMYALFGPYGMNREASGTSWQPESAAHEGLHAVRGPWQLMAHGYATLAFSDQAGLRRDTKTFGQNMLMGVASRQLGVGRLGFRAMFSFEPWSIGRFGYPLVLQTGETANGVAPLVDRQHPHDVFMELSATYSVPVGKDGSVFIYLGEPGEPALGPPAFMHRFSGMENPEAPLSHHWLDSTHIAFGVITLGWIRGDLKLEGSAFSGREPDEQRTNIEASRLDSYSFRASYQPAPNWSLQASFGHLQSPEQLEPGVDTNRSTISVIYNQPLADGSWQTMLAWGRNEKSPGRSTNALLLESAANLGTRHTLFGRVERLENDELIGNGGIARLGKVSLGDVYDGLKAGSLRTGIGLVGSISRVPRELEPRYGGRTLYSWMCFLRFRVAGPAMDSSMRM